MGPAGGLNYPAVMDSVLGGGGNGGVLVVFGDLLSSALFKSYGSGVDQCLYARLVHPQLILTGRECSLNDTLFY